MQHALVLPVSVLLGLEEDSRGQQCLSWQQGTASPASLEFAPWTVREDCCVNRATAAPARWPHHSPCCAVQEKQKKEAAAANGKGVKQSAGELRLQKGALLPCCPCTGV